MKKTRGRLGMIIPVPIQEHSDRFAQFEISDVQLWMRKLPRNQIGACSKFLYDLLVELNLTHLDYQARHEVLEAVFPHVAFVNSAMSERYILDKTADHNQMIKISLLMQSLNLELCLGYKLILEQTGGAFRKNKKMFLQCLHHLTILNLEILQESYRMHTTPSKHVWHELHLTYRYAEKHKILNNTVEHFDSRPIRHHTVANAYKHALLLVCSNPYRFSNEQFLHLNYCLEAWAPLLNLSAKPDNNKLFVVDLDSDSPPRFSGKGAPVKHALFLDFAKIIERIDQTIRHIHQQGAYHLNKNSMPADFHLPLSMLRFLKNTWSQYFVRTHERIPQQGVTQAALGLSATFLAIAQNAGLIPSETTQDDANENDDEIILGEDSKVTSGFTQADLDAFELHPVQVLDISADGLCIEWPKRPGHLQTGELIGFETSTESHGMLSLGVICWIRTKDHKTRSGIKILSPYAKPILTMPANSAHPIKTLLLPSDPNAQSYTTLVTPLRPFKAGDKVTLTYQKQTFEVLLKEDLEPSNHFHMFHITSIDHQEIPFLDFEHTQPLDDLWASMENLKSS